MILQMAQEQLPLFPPSSRITFPNLDATRLPTSQPTTSLPVKETDKRITSYDIQFHFGLELTKINAL
jgi:hypothetical protein